MKSVSTVWTDLWKQIWNMCMENECTHMYPVMNLYEAKPVYPHIILKIKFLKYY